MERSKNVIIDTNMGADCGDAGALAILNKLCDFGEAKILAVGCCSHSLDQAGCIDAINRYYGRFDIPVGMSKSETVVSQDAGFAGYIRNNFENIFISSTVPNVVDMYRKVLSDAADESVIFISIGPLTNLAGLMRSAPDMYSRFDGLALMKAKIRKIVCMAGSFALMDGVPKVEYNVAADIEACSYVTESWTGELVFCPYETGLHIYTGNRLIASGNMKKNPVAKAYQLFCTDVNCLISGDLVTVYYAVRGSHGLFKESKRGRFTIGETGVSSFSNSPEGRHYYIANKLPPIEISQIFEDIINLTPELVKSL